MSFPGLPGMPPSAGGNSMSEQEQKMVKMVQHPQRFSQIIGHTLITHLFQVQAGMESCAVKTVMAGGMGFALGGLFGFFISSVRIPALYCSNLPTWSTPPEIHILKLHL